MTTPPTPSALPYKLACLCDLRDDQGRILLIRRKKAPNMGLVSPIGGKLDMHTGESPHQCAQREIMEEAGIEVPIDRLHLGGMIAEKAFEGAGHWLLFYYRVLGPVQVESREIREGTLEWFDPDHLDELPLPETDRRVIWPAIRRLEERQVAGPEGTPLGFFSVHIDCSGDDMVWSLEQEL